MESRQDKPHQWALIKRNKEIFIGVRIYCKGKSYRHVWVMSGNIKAISYVNNKGRIKSESCELRIKSYGCGVRHKICGYQLHTFLKHKTLKQIVFLETSVMLVSIN